MNTEDSELKIQLAKALNARLDRLTLMTQTEIGELLGVGQSRVSEIRNMELDDTSVIHLIEYLSKIGCRVGINIDVPGKDYIPTPVPVNVLTFTPEDLEQVDLEADDKRLLNRAMQVYARYCAHDNHALASAAYAYTQELKRRLAQRVHGLPEASEADTVYMIRDHDKDYWRITTRAHHTAIRKNGSAEVDVLYRHSGTAVPVPLILFCPKCGLQHVDAPSTKHMLYTTGDENCPDTLMDRNGDVVLAQCKVCGKAEIELDQPCTWTNPPHRSHLCHGCGYQWRPSDVPTTGILSTRTCGEGDSSAVPHSGE